MAEVEMYMTMFCPYCSRARALLQQKGVGFVEIDIAEEPERRAEMIERAGGRTDGAANLYRRRAYRRLRRPRGARPRRQARPEAWGRAMTATFTAACMQFTAARDHEPNIQIVSELVRRARDAGADFVLTPENTGLIEPIGKLRREKARDEANHPVLAALREVARETGAWLLIGSLAVDISNEPGIAEGERRLANRSYLIDAGGGIVARYDKIHMFDVDLAGGESYRESNAFRPGGEAVLALTPWGVLGMTVCYDLRFPQLYRALAHGGADFLAIPSSFTVPDRQGALARAVAGAGDRERLLCVCAGAMGRARRTAADLRSLADRRSVGRGARRCRRGCRHRQRTDRPGAHRRGPPHGPVAKSRPAIRDAAAGRASARRRIA